MVAINIIIELRFKVTEFKEFRPQQPSTSLLTPLVIIAGVQLQGVTCKHGRNGVFGAANDHAKYANNAGNAFTNSKIDAAAFPDYA